MKVFGLKQWKYVAVLLLAPVTLVFAGFLGTFVCDSCNPSDPTDPDTPLFIRTDPNSSILNWRVGDYITINGPNGTSGNWGRASALSTHVYMGPGTGSGGGGNEGGGPGSGGGGGGGGGWNPLDPCANQLIIHCQGH